jgi:hypothetical protein
LWEMSTDPPDSLLVWFQLLDSDSGQPYEGTSASSILRSSLSVPTVDQFREAVKAKNRNKLFIVDSSDLLVYKNKAAFDKRNDAIDEEEPLMSYHSLKDFGKTEKDALIVAFPINSLGIYTVWTDNG